MFVPDLLVRYRRAHEHVIDRLRESFGAAWFASQMAGW